MDFFDRAAVSASGVGAAVVGILKGHSALRRSVARDHARISTLIRRAGGGGRSIADRRRQDLFDDLVLLLNTYLSTEKKELFLPFEQYLADPEVIFELIHEQREIGTLLLRLGSAKAGSETWLQRFKWFEQRVQAHFRRVDEQLMPAMEEAIPGWDRDIMTVRYRVEIDWSGAALRARLRRPTI